MKTGAVMALCLLAAVVTGGVMILGTTDAAAAQCIAAAHEIAELTRMGDWQRAGAALDAYAAQWKTSRARFDMFIPHENLDGITTAFEELGTGVEFQNPEYCTEKCLALASSAERMRTAEQVCLRNIL